MKAYKAYGTRGHVTDDSPKKAAKKYFDTFPDSRKCDVIEGEYDGLFFTVKFGRVSSGEWPYSVKTLLKSRLKACRISAK